MQTIIYPVRDLAQVKKLYGALVGVATASDESSCGSFRAADQDIGLDPGDHGQRMREPITCWNEADVKATLATLQGAPSS